MCAAYDEPRSVLFTGYDDGAVYLRSVRLAARRGGVCAPVAAVRGTSLSTAGARVCTALHRVVICACTCRNKSQPRCLSCAFVRTRAGAGVPAD
jgi:hypothetical protein